MPTKAIFPGLRAVQLSRQPPLFIAWLPQWANLSSLFKSGIRKINRHLAGAAVEAEREAAAVVEEIEGAAVRGALVHRAHSQFVADAVAAAH